MEYKGFYIKPFNVVKTSFFCIIIPKESKHISTNSIEKNLYILEDGSLGYMNDKIDLMKFYTRDDAIKKAKLCIDSYHMLIKLNKILIKI